MFAGHLGLGESQIRASARKLTFMSFDNYNDLLPIADDFVLQDAADWRNDATGQLWRMFNERLLLDAKQVVWTQVGYTEYDPVGIG